MGSKLKRQAGSQVFLRYIDIESGSVKAPGANGATWEDLGISGVWQFPNALDRYLVVTLPMPNDIDISENMPILIGWSSPDNTAGHTVSWVLEYLLRSEGEDMSAVADGSITHDAGVSSTVNGLVVTEFLIPNATISLSDKVILLRLMRDGDGLNDTCTDVANVCGVCVDYTSDR